LKHYKVLHEHDVIRRALLTISCGGDSAFGGRAVMRRTSLQDRESDPQVVPAAEQSLWRKIRCRKTYITAFKAWLR
jgi:hypothetical protein